ncbi:class I SAM-dependent methyltransferase [Cumulibacter manganitolerans]|uniref:class I SAM-dependent methyltransferase n=1 Tax=Cumulibacter manganitolerans TaxID=1884992 RepID=UPI00129530C4|nr:methyltransferase [Cumulibacter manganitolerans]
MRTGGDHYFSSTPGALSDPKEVDVLLPDVDLTLWTDAGVFSHGRLDAATRIFLETAPAPPPTGVLLDLGCGYGPIALVLASRSPKAQVLAVDVNERALGLVRRNADRNGLRNVTASLPEDVPEDLELAAIYANPPIRIGKQAMREMLLHWLSRLAADGVAYLVVGKHLGSDSLAGWLEEQGFEVVRMASRNSYRTLEVRHGKDVA